MMPGRSTELERLQLQSRVWERAGERLLARLRLPLQFAAYLEARLVGLIGSEELAVLQAQAEDEIAMPYRWGTTFTLI
jgi:hypothetical protein